MALYLVSSNSSLVLETITNVLVTALVYFLAITLIGLLAKIPGKGLGILKVHIGAPSSWIKRN